MGMFSADEQPWVIEITNDLRKSIELLESLINNTFNENTSKEIEEARQLINKVKANDMVFYRYKYNLG